MVAGTPWGERVRGKRVAIEGRLPLTGLGAHEAVKIFEAEARGPAIVRTSGVDLPHGCIVPFSETGGAVAVFLEHFGHGSRLFRPQRVISGITGRQFSNVAESDLVTVASCKQRSAGRGTHGVDVETVIAKSAVGKLLKFGRVHRTAENTGRAETHVVQKNQEHVRRSGVCLGALRPIGF